MIAASTAKAKNNAGNVILVGCAARLMANTGTLTVQTAIHKAKLLSAKNKMADSVTGTANPIMPKKVNESHKSRLFSWLSHQVINVEKTLVLDDTAVL